MNTSDLGPSTLVFATSFIRDELSWTTRYQRWFQFYLQSPLSHLPLVLIDDGSTFVPSDPLINIYSPDDCSNLQAGRLNIVRFADNLGRASLTDYQGWWRSFLFSGKLARQIGCAKLIHIESDAYILSQRLFDQLLATDQGWTTMWLPTYAMPETAIQIICSDQFDNLEGMHAHPALNVELAEKILPFTHIDKTMLGDRYSEFKRNRWIFRSKKFDRFPPFKTNLFFASIPNTADFATQVVDRQFNDPRLIAAAVSTLK